MNKKYNERIAGLKELMSKRIVVLDGAMGTMIQHCNLSEEDFKGSHFAHCEQQLKGCNDVLVLTAPEVIKNIHRQYLDAGANIIETNSFNANAISMVEYGLTDHVEKINHKAARLARESVDEYCLLHPGEQCWVAGSVGPTSKSLSMSAGIDAEKICWDTLVEAYVEQMSALISGGVDLLLIETVFDGLNAKAALYAAQKSMTAVGIDVPIMMSVTLTESGRTLSGQTLDAFVATVAHGDLLSIGLNCGFGADGMIPHINALQDEPMAVSVYPNAGLPNEMGEYDETPETMVEKLLPLLSSGKLNIVGGCCGTTPEHIAAIAHEAQKYAPREVPTKKQEMILAGLEKMSILQDHLFINVGERCNVAGSRKFLRLINEKNIEEAVEIARSQVMAGAQIVDINMDDAMLDAPIEMASFIDNIGLEPDVARVPLMIDSSNWEAVVAGLQHTQGRPIVNSISLKEGEAKFVEKASFIKSMGAAVVVMAFDEKGQADTYERKIEVCERAYRILTETVGFNGCDIIFDPNVLAVATGIEAHNNYALDFIKAVEWIKNNLLGAKVSGGISNLSFSFRGNNYVREAMHALFLYHAIGKGMDMGIVNPSSLMSVDDIPSELRDALDDVLLNRRGDATEHLVEIAEKIKAERESTVAGVKAVVEQKELSASERIEQMIMRGNSDGIEPFLDEVMAGAGSAVAVIDGPLMTGINKVGEQFGAGKMFLPQVVKSARAMKQAVAYLTPFIEKEKQSSGTSSSGKIVIATVKGDVHDIGKNIVSVIMNCNGFEMIDLGVMVPAEEIVVKAIEENVDFVALSGLITPSLEEMCNVARQMDQKGLKIPLLIGGATTSELHTAVKIAPCYSGLVVYMRDAAMLPGLAQRLINKDTRVETSQEILSAQQLLREQYENKKSQLTIEEARRLKFDYGKDTVIPTPKYPGIHDLSIAIADIRASINWRAFLGAWKLDASFASIADIQGCDHCRAQWLATVPQEQRMKAAEAMQLFKDANRVIDYIQKNIGTLQARVAILPAGSRDEDIFYQNGNEEFVLPTPRQLHVDGVGPRLALADYVKPLSVTGEKNDWMGLFVVTAGMDIQQIIEKYKSQNDDYNAILYQSIADRLVEAATEKINSLVREELWGYEAKGIRPAIGYPSLPDQRLVFLADEVLNYGELGITLTENGALYPSATTTGYIFVHPGAHYFAL